MAAKSIRFPKNESSRGVVYGADGEHSCWVAKLFIATVSTRFRAIHHSTASVETRTPKNARRRELWICNLINLVSGRLSVI